MGDFNDTPNNKSLMLLSDRHFVNLSKDFNSPKKNGTLKYKSHWQVFDQFVVSKNLTDSTLSIVTAPGGFQIINHSFLLEEDSKYGGTKPIRTYYGPYYRGGFSDHLPILLKINHIVQNQ